MPRLDPVLLLGALVGGRAGPVHGRVRAEHHRRVEGHQHRAGKGIRHRLERAVGPVRHPGLLADDDDPVRDRAVIVVGRDGLGDLGLRDDDALVVRRAPGAERRAVRVDARERPGQRAQVERRDGAVEVGRRVATRDRRGIGRRRRGRRRAVRCGGRTAATAGSDDQSGQEESSARDGGARGSDHVGHSPFRRPGHPPARRDDGGTCPLVQGDYQAAQRTAVEPDPLPGEPLRGGVPREEDDHLERDRQPGRRRRRPTAPGWCRSASRPRRRPAARRRSRCSANALSGKAANSSV